MNVLVYPHRVLLLTDTKATTAEGVQFHAVKTALFPWMRMALAVRGHIGALRVFERLISQNCTGYDGAVQFLAEHFDEARAATYLDATEAHAMQADLDVYIAGWGINGPAAAWISSYQNGGQIQRISQCHIAPMVEREAQRRFAPDVKNGMQQLMADQAAQHPHAVGGFAVVTDIQEHCIMTYPAGKLDGLAEVTTRMAVG